MAVGHNILERKLATLQVGDLVRRELPLPLLLHVGVVLAVVLWINDASGLVVLEVRDDIAPSLVIVDAQSDDADLVPGSTIGVIPHRLLDDAEKLVLVGIDLEDQHLDRITLTHFCDW